MRLSLMKKGRLVADKLSRKSQIRCNSSAGRPEAYGEGQIRQDHAYCVNLVRDRDREGYLCGLLMPRYSQRSYFALRAFNAELASVKDSSSRRRRLVQDGASLLPLQMRMQWWRDAIAAVYNENTVSPSLLSSISWWHSPVVRAMDRAVTQEQFTRRFLERLIDAREQDLHVSRQYETMDQCIQYADDTVSSLLYLSLECVGVRDDKADDVASLVGIGIGLATNLRAAPFRLLQGEVPFPSELFPPTFDYDDLFRMMMIEDDETTTTSDIPQAAAHGSSPETTEIVNHAARVMAAQSKSYLSEAQGLQSHVPRPGRVCLLPAIPSLHYLARLERTKYNVLDGKLNDPNVDRLSLLFKLGKGWLTGTF